MKINRKGSAVWSGGLKDGKGTISTQSGALSAYPYGFSSRFEGKPGTNPEELIGAAHAGCFTMALSLILSEAGLTATRMETTATVTLEQVSGGFAITAIHLDLNSRGAWHRSGGFRSPRDQGQSQLPGVETHEGRDFAQHSARLNSKGNLRA